ncbi:hypothetical protein ACWDA7_49305 [Streptomyces sp. NPDC001156]
MLDVFAEGDAYKVVMSGVIRPGQPVPPIPVGATRNIVQTRLEPPQRVHAFAIERTAGDRT